MNARKLMAAAIAATALYASGATAQTVKVGIINTYSGPFAEPGSLIDRGITLYMKQHEKDLPPGVKIELIKRDDTGPQPDVAKRLAQELITRDQVQLLAGIVYTPNALAVAPLVTEAKVPLIVMNASTPVITMKSPYIARVSFTLWHSSYPLGQWAAKHDIKTAYTAVSDYAPAPTPRRPSSRVSPRAAARSWAPCAFRSRTRTSRPICRRPRTRIRPRSSSLSRRAPRRSRS